MKFIKEKLPVLILSLCLCFNAAAQDIWPGDINNNGIVNGVDVLFLGLGFNATGAVRTGASVNWQAEPITTPWVQDFPNGVNFAYGDCNGDGIINETDLEDAIEENFGLTHGTLTPDTYENGVAGMAPPLGLQASTAVAFPGESFNVDLFLGDMDFPIGDFYGITFTLRFDQDLLATDDGIEFDLSADSWIDLTGEDESETFFEEDDMGNGEIAITRIDQQPISGMGRIGTFSIIIEDIIVGLELDTFNIIIEDVKMIDVDFNTFPVVPASTFVVIAQDSSFLNSTFEPLSSSLVNVYPNPVQDQLLIESNLQVETIKLVNAVGQLLTIPTPEASGNNTITIPDAVPDGIYILQLYCKEGIVNKRIIIQSG